MKDERKASIKKICVFFKNLLLYGGIKKEEFEEITDIITTYNRNVSLVFSIIAFFPIMIMMIASYNRPEFSTSRAVYAMGLFTSICIFALSLCGNKTGATTWASVYIAETAYIAYGFIIGIFTRVDQQTTTFMVLLVLLPLIYVDKPIITNLLTIGSSALFAVCAYINKPVEVRYVDMYDALIFGTLSVLAGTAVIRSRIRGMYLDYKIRHFSETDQLTGLRNRNSYELALDNYRKHFEHTLTCVYIDVNGLHETNNAQGHDVGDNMLIYIASVVKDVFSEKESFRIGGDEFVAFLPDLRYDGVVEKIKQFDDLLAEKGYHAAIGTSTHGFLEYDIHRLIKDAEYAMYRAKKCWYQKQGKEFR